MWTSRIRYWSVRHGMFFKRDFLSCIAGALGNTAVEKDGWLGSALLHFPCPVTVSLETPSGFCCIVHILCSRHKSVFISRLHWSGSFDCCFFYEGTSTIFNEVGQVQLQPQQFMSMTIHHLEYFQACACGIQVREILMLLMFFGSTPIKWVWTWMKVLYLKLVVQLFNALRAVHRICSVPIWGKKRVIEMFE